MSLTQQRLKELLDYDPESGIFTWKVRSNSKVPAGAIAGSYTRGRFQIGINGRIYRSHRLAWLWVHGEWAPETIDHINCISSDNRIANLRLATRRQNQGNRRRRSDSKCAFKGVTKSRGQKTFRAQITTGGKTIHLGCFSTAFSAHEAYCRAAVEQFGEFARFR